jgi:serine/threonine protein kinase/tetratricopeptide (TPR) repeat protein
MVATTEHTFPEAFDIIRKIGSGGTAEVFLAHCRTCAHPIVLKRFYDPAARSLVERELAVARRIHFPGLVRFHTAGCTEDGHHFLQMEYCPGPTLDALTGKLSEKKLLAVLSAVSASLYVLHQTGYLHNDIKGSNIFCPVGFECDDFAVDRLFHLKLADFSLSRMPTEETETVTGTVGYMSPEMILRRKLSFASDLFSLGVMAYQLACGQLPFGSPTGDPLDINARITEGARPRLQEPAASFSRATIDLLGSLLAIDPDQRPSSAFALMEALSQAGSPYPFRKAVRPRHLLWGIDTIDAAALERLFGTGSFSPQQQKLLNQTTGYDPHVVRVILEDNFDRGNFARMDGRWGWRTERADAVEWSRRMIRFSLLPLRGTSRCLKRLALATAIVGDARFAAKVKDAVIQDRGDAWTEWETIPESRRPALVHALDRLMHPRTRNILAKRMAGRFREADNQPALTGRLLCFAGEYAPAMEYMNKGIDACLTRFEHDEAFALIDMGVHAAEQLNDVSQRAAFLLRKARLEKALGMLSDSKDTYVQVIALLENTGLDKLLAQAYMELGDLYRATSDHQNGIAVSSRALELYTRLEDQLGLSHTLINLGNMCWLAGRLDQALDYYQRALAIQRQLRSEKEIGISLNNIASIHLIKGAYAEAIAHYNESLVIRERLGDKIQLAQTWNNLGATHFLMGDAAGAVEAFSRSLQSNRETGTLADQLSNVENLAEAMIQAGRLTDALAYVKEGTELAEKLGDDAHRCTVERLTGQLLRRMGHYDNAEARLTGARTLAEKIDNKALLLLALIELAHLYTHLRENASAVEPLATAGEIAANIGDQSASFQVALIRFTGVGQEQDRTAAEQLVGGLNSIRDKALWYLALLEHNNLLALTDGSAEYLGHAERFFAGQEEDIDLARFYQAAGMFRKLSGDRDEARAQLDRAMTLAARVNLLPELWQAASELSEVTFTAGEFEASFAYARKATDTLKKTAGCITSPGRLRRFYSDQRIISLLGRIKSLQGVLGKSKGAAIGSP